MQIKELLNDDRAVSPVIGVILMVAITVILAAVIGTFVLGLGDQVSQTTPNASFQFDYTNNSGGVDTLEISHGGGDTIEGAELNASASGAENEATNTEVNIEEDVFSQDEVSAGTTHTLDDASFSGNPGNLNLAGATVRVVWQSAEGDSSAQLGRWDGPDA